MKNTISYASNLIRHFVESFKDFYGTSSISHNIHALIHLPGDYKKQWTPRKYFCISIRKFYAAYKKKIGSGAKPLQQLICRYEEHRTYAVNMINDQKVELGPINTICQNRNRPLIFGIGSPQFSGRRTENFVITINKSDCCVKTNNGSILLIENTAF